MRTPFTYEQFKQKIQNLVQVQLCDSSCVRITPVTKNNNIILDGLTILDPKWNTSPTIYLNHFYDDYLQGKDLTQITNQILDIYRTNRLDHNIDVSFFTDFEKAKDHIVYKIVNQKKNQPLLQEVPFLPYLDLAIVFYCLVPSAECGNASILIRNPHVKAWDISIDTLYEHACQNTPLLLHYDLQNMADVISDLFLADLSSELTDPDEILAEITDSSYPMFVLSNQRKMNGAACILYQDLLKDFSAKLDSDLFILPSSVHEVILVPAKDLSSVSEFNQMVQDVNRTQVADEEILADHIYYFSRQLNEISIAP